MLTSAFTCALVLSRALIESSNFLIKSETVESSAYVPSFFSTFLASSKALLKLVFSGSFALANLPLISASSAFLTSFCKLSILPSRYLAFATSSFMSWSLIRLSIFSCISFIWALFKWDNLSISSFACFCFALACAISTIESIWPFVVAWFIWFL